MRLSTSPFKMTDVVGLKLRPCDQKQFEMDGEHLAMALESLAKLGPVKTVRNEHGQVVTIVGIRIMDDDMGEVWQVPADGMAEKCSVNFVRLLKALEKIQAERYGLRYLYTWCPDDEHHERWMQYMGYEMVQKVKGLGWPHGADSVLFSKVVSYGRS
jgi:hypothetical protein